MNVLSPFFICAIIIIISFYYAVLIIHSYLPNKSTFAVIDRRGTTRVFLSFSLFLSFPKKRGKSQCALGYTM